MQNGDQIVARFNVSAYRRTCQKEINQTETVSAVVAVAVVLCRAVGLGRDGWPYEYSNRTLHFDAFIERLDLVQSGTAGGNGDRRH